MTRKTESILKRMNDISLKSCWHFSQRVMESFWKILLKGLLWKFRFQRFGAFTGFRSQWKTFTVKHIVNWSRLMWTTHKREDIYWTPLLRSRALKRRRNERLSGLKATARLLKDWSDMLVWKAFCFQGVSALFIGLKREVWCLDSLLAMNSFHAMKVCILIFHVFYIRRLKINSRQVKFIK